MYGKIFDIQHCSLSDGNGIRTAIFLKGCPLRCAWCHNPESQSADSELLFTRINARGAENVCAIAPRGGLKTEESSSTANFARYAANARKSAPPAQTKSAAKSFRRKKSSPKRKKISRSILRAALRKEASRSRAENRRRKRNFRLNSFGLRKKRHRYGDRNLRLRLARFFCPGSKSGQHVFIRYKTPQRNNASKTYGRGQRFNSRKFKTAVRYKRKNRRSTAADSGRERR